MAAQEDELIDNINRATVKINLFWAGRGAVMIEESNSLGVVVSSEGHVLTCYHSVILSSNTEEEYGVLSGIIADTINLEYFCNGERKSISGKVIDVDEWRDLAIIEPCEKPEGFFVPEINKIINKESIFYASVNPENPWNSVSSGKLIYPVLSDNGKSVMGFRMNITSGSSGAGLFDCCGNLTGLIYATGEVEGNTSGGEITLAVPVQSLAIFLARNNIYTSE